MRKNMYFLAPVMALSLAASVFTGCGDAKEEQTTAAAGEEKAETEKAEEAEKEEKEEAAAPGKDSLIIATANETGSVTTNLHNSVAGSYLNKMTNNALFYVDENLVPQPDLVDTYENVSDTEWIFHLKQGVKFHNGAEMTAKDVKASLDLCKESPEVAQYGKSTGEIEIVDDYTIKITTDGPQAGLLNDLCHHGNMILPADLIESGHNFNKEPIGTGPYKLVSWNKGESIELEAYDDYFKGAPAIKKVVWKIIPEGSSRTMALEAGEADMIIEVENNDVQRLKDNPDVTVYDEAGTLHNFMMINNEKAPFNNIEFRRALASAIDKAAIVKVALNGGGSPVDCMVPNCFPGTSDEGAETFDPAKAKEHLEASGLKPEDCGFALICSNDLKLRAGQVIQSCLKDNLGIDITLESMDLATYMDKTATGDYEAAIGGFNVSSLLAYAEGVYHSKSINASNKTRTNEPEIDALIDKLQTTVDQAENEKIAAELTVALNENCPQVPLWMENNRRAYNSDLQGFNINAVGQTDYAVFNWGN